MMNYPLKVLHLEDNAMDAELIGQSLENAGIQCRITRVEDEDSFTGALKDRSFDLVISDFSMPGYSGSDALHFVHENYPEIPFIFVSGTVGEDFAIDSLLNGATDYVLKNKMSRLIPAVKRAIDESSEKAGRRNAEKALDESNRRFRALVEDSVDGITVFGEDGKVIYRSPQNVAILGQDNYAASGGEAFENVHPDDLDALNASMDQLIRGASAKFTETFRYKHGDGSWRWLEAKFSDLRSEPAVGGIVCNFIDVTEKREAEIALRQSQKLESLGTLAGGIAHDFNNILAIISGYTSFLKRRQLDEEKYAQSISAIQSATERGVGLVRQLLMFSRKQETEFVPLKINDIVNEVYQLIAETFPKVISSSIDLGVTPLAVADHVQVNQCILNLCVNARDAMMDRNDGKPSGGSLRISTYAAERTFPPEKGDADTTRKFVAVSVRDTGTGIDDKTKEKIFEPFFTTKEKGKGTGIGLSTVFGVMKKHHGLVELETEIGSGTTFTLLFPAVVDEEERIAEEDDTTTGAEGGSEKILVVEDEETLRELLKDMLEDQGYSVQTAGDGNEALELLRHRQDFSLMICDLGLPGLDGIEVLTRVKEAGAKIKVMLASGYIDPEESNRIARLKIDGIIEKPYKPDEVLKKVRAILDSV